MISDNKFASGDTIHYGITSHLKQPDETLQILYARFWTTQLLYSKEILAVLGCTEYAIESKKKLSNSLAEETECCPIVKLLVYHQYTTKSNIDQQKQIIDTARQSVQSYRTFLKDCQTTALGSKALQKDTISFQFGPILSHLIRVHDFSMDEIRIVFPEALN